MSRQQRARRLRVGCQVGLSSRAWLVDLKTLGNDARSVLHQVIVTNLTKVAAHHGPNFVADVSPHCSAVVQAVVEPHASRGIPGRIELEFKANLACRAFER